MLDLYISKEELDWLANEFPKLKVYRFSPKRVRGTLEFQAYYDAETENLNLYPDDNLNNHKNFISDTYPIEIVLEKSSFSDLPQVRELGGKIAKVALLKGKELKDMHIYEDSLLCLSSPLTEMDIFNGKFCFKDFFYKRVIPFFYAQSFYKTYNAWPWGEYSHGILGLLESYNNLKSTSRELTSKCLELLQKLELKVQKNQQYASQIFSKKTGLLLCPCDIRKKNRRYFSLCHRQAFEGFKKLRSDTRENLSKAL